MLHHLNTCVWLAAVRMDAVSQPPVCVTTQLLTHEYYCSTVDDSSAGVLGFALWSQQKMHAPEHTAFVVNN